VTALLDEAVSRGKPMWDVMRDRGNVRALSASAAEAIGKFVVAIEAFRQRLETQPLVDVARALVHQIGYRDEINRRYSDAHDQQARWSAVEEVINALAAYEQRSQRPTLLGFLDDVALVDREDESDKEGQLARNAVALLTLHSAKGLEFPQVYLVGIEEGLLPHRLSVESGGAAIDEERRLCYVGITRAQRRLTISLALARMKWGKLRESTPSRFLFEITGQADRSAKAQAQKQSGRGAALHNRPRKSRSAQPRDSRS
jgi:DNA helicase-2/ATP-dependent DNA helicase PcrA